MAACPLEEIERLDLLIVLLLKSILSETLLTITSSFCYITKKRRQDGQVKEPHEPQSDQEGSQKWYQEASDEQVPELERSQ